MEHHVGGKRDDWWTIEHLNSSPPFNDPSTWAICCWQCNSSRGNKELLEWFKTPYCIKRNINKETAAAPVKEYIRATMR